MRIPFTKLKDIVKYILDISLYGVSRTLSDEVLQKYKKTVFNMYFVSFFAGKNSIQLICGAGLVIR